MPDRETTEFYTFGVEAVNDRVPAMSSSTSVSVTILDVNDNTPTFTQRLYNIKINEDVSVGTSVLLLSAIDRDANSVVTYQISSGNTRNRFSITSQSAGGLITLALLLDYKQERQYVLIVTASDGTRQDMAQVYVSVTDANTDRPVFQSTSYRVMLSEDWPIGSTVAVISATDEDTGENARISYIMEDKVPQLVPMITLPSSKETSTRALCSRTLQFIPVFCRSLPPTETPVLMSESATPSIQDINFIYPSRGDCTQQVTTQINRKGKKTQLITTLKNSHRLLGFKTGSMWFKVSKLKSCIHKCCQT